MSYKHDTSGHLYLEFDSNIQEKKYLIEKINDYFERNADKTKVTVITDNVKTIQTLCVALSRLDIINFSGYSTLNNKVIHFLLLLADLFGHPVKLVNLVNLSKSSFINLDIHDFELFINENHLQNKNAQNIVTILCSQWPSVHNIYSNISKVQSFTNKETINVSELFHLNIEIMEKIKPNIWSTNDGKDVMEYLQNVLDTCKYAGKIKVKEYSLILQMLLSGKYYQSCKIHANQVVQIMSPNHLPYLDQDPEQLVLVPDFHQGNWPPNINQDAWLTHNMRQKLNLENDVGKNNDLYSCYFNQLSLYPNVIFSRAMRVNKSYTRQSKYSPTKITHIPDQEINNAYKTHNHEEIHNQDSQKAKVCFTGLQDQIERISATQVDLLIKNPYAFYAKKKS